jgi:hypothetical protein
MIRVAKFSGTLCKTGCAQPTFAEILSSQLI